MVSNVKNDFRVESLRQAKASLLKDLVLKPSVMEIRPRFPLLDDLSACALVIPSQV